MYFLELIENCGGKSRLTVAHDGRVSVKISPADMVHKDQLVAFSMEVAEQGDCYQSARGRFVISCGKVKVSLYTGGTNNRPSKNFICSYTKDIELVSKAPD